MEHFADLEQHRWQIFLLQKVHFVIPNSVGMCKRTPERIPEVQKSSNADEDNAKLRELAAAVAGGCALILLTLVRW